MRPTSDAVHLGGPVRVAELGSLGAEGRRRVGEVHYKLARRPASTGRDLLVAHLHARVLGRDGAGPRPDQQVRQPVGVARKVSQYVPAAPARQCGRAAGLLVGNPGDGCQHPRGCYVYSLTEFSSPRGGFRLR
jgi:hypothetical protein